MKKTFKLKPWYVSDLDKYRFSLQYSSIIGYIDVITKRDKVIMFDHSSDAVDYLEDLYDDYQLIRG
jgi:hypothetical protein